VSGGSASGGLFKAGSSLQSVAVEGQSVPGAGPIASITSLPDIASDGAVAASLAFASGPIAGGVYVHSGGVFTPVALAGEIPAGAGGAALASFGFLSRNQAGRVAFVATLGDGRSGVFLATPVAAVPALTGPAPLALGLLLAAVAVWRLRLSGRNRL
jgi:hypothetical protein